MDQVCMCEPQLDDIKLILTDVDTKINKLTDDIDNFKLTQSNNAYLVFFLVIIAFIAFDFWTETVHRFTIQVLHDNQIPSWKRTAIYSLIVTGIFLAIVYFSNVQLVQFESL